MPSDTRPVQSPAQLLRQLGGDVAESHQPLIPHFGGLHGRVGVFGGSFDPPHLGHLIAARSLLRQLALDACVFVPTHRNPLKAAAPEADDAARLRMLQLALEHEPLLYASGIELPSDPAAGVPSYTVDTLRNIKAQLPAGTPIFFFIGSDIIASLPRWRSVELLAELATFTAYVRAGYPAAGTEALAALPPALRRQIERRLYTVPAVDCSATAIRAQLARGILPHSMLPAAVAEYIESTGLYRPSNQGVQF